MESIKHLVTALFPNGGLFLFIVIFMFAGCATAKQEFGPNVTGPQMIVEPKTIRLGVAKLMGTEIVFRGKGFEPDDSVFVQLLRVEKKGERVDIPIADGNVDQKGCFIAKVGRITKLTDLLRAKLGNNDKMENIIIITQPPIPEGVYTARAVSMDSDKKAECKLLIKGPSFMDKIKDWIGGLMGKIVKK
ncbi:MAG: hypothetical protein U9R17_10395 [Thermodesulfobacteriota bacterium]|nr:hypothetical protein [Thermodesulfobacteriota bacterium]